MVVDHVYLLCLYVDKIVALLYFVADKNDNSYVGFTASLTQRWDWNQPNTQTKSRENN